MRVHVVDPSAFTRPYDHALCSALARAGAETTLVTSRFAHGDAPAPDGYTLAERFYRRQPAGNRARRAAKLLQHVPGMLAERRAARRGADVVHFQWLAVQHLDAHLLPRRPVVLTSHDVLPREPRAGQRAAQRRLHDRVDALVVHSRHSRDRLVAEGADPARVHVIPHGAFTHLGGLDGALPRELPATDRPVVLFFGLLRPYKGLDVLLEAWNGMEDAELWIVGRPRMPTAALHKASPPNVRWVERFVSDAEAAALFRRADLAVLPYKEIEQSGVLATAIGFGTPVVASAVGGFREVEGAVLVPPSDPDALRSALTRAIEAPPSPIDPAPYGWESIARAHLDLYETLL